MKKFLLLFLLLAFSTDFLISKDFGCKTEYVDKKLKVEVCDTQKSPDPEHSTLFFINLTQNTLRIKFSYKTWYNCKNYNAFSNPAKYEEGIETIYVEPEGERRYTVARTADSAKRATCPAYLQKFDLIEYSVKAQESKEVPW